MDSSNGIASRKRKAASPAKPEPKRPAPASRPKPASQNIMASGRTAAASKAAVSGRKGAPASGAEEQNWQQISEETGWSPEDCLNHKLVFKKREDVKTLKETLLQYIRRLRALVKHLLTEIEGLQSGLDEAKQALQTEEKARKDETGALSLKLAALQTEKTGLETKVADLGKKIDVTSQTLSQAQSRLQAEESKSSALLQKNDRLEAEGKHLQQQLEDARAQVVHATELHQQAQKYNAQLQEYNSKLQVDVQAATTTLASLQGAKNSWSEEMAGLRGKIAALESQLAAAQNAAASADEARQLAVSDASRLRAEVEQAVKQRDLNHQDASSLQQELSRFKECTGQSIENLEREKASKALLQNQNKAQVEFNSELRDEVGKLQAQLAMATANADRQAAKAAEIEIARATAAAALEAAELKIREGEILRRKLHNAILELKGNIRVFCRVRPLSQDNLTTEVLDGKPLVQFPASAGEFEAQGLELSTANAAANQPGSHKFSFDRVFGPTSQQEEVFEEISQLVQSALDGYKVCIFAYGQTGSGKTYTMVGPANPEHAGVIPRAVRQLFDASQQMESQGWTFEMKASMLEIYNEEIRDLLGKALPAGKKHQISHDERSGTSVSFLESIDCKRPEKVRDLLAKATRMRSVGATAANEQSSRSHMVFGMNITGHHEASGQQIKGVLNLIDLAGSERLSKSLATGDRLKETQAINKSLSALGDVIMALGNKESHVPFRNSKLTYLLQPCLGGDAKTLMFVNIAPTADAAGESLCSLRFAAKVNATEIGTAKRNVASKP